MKQSQIHDYVGMWVHPSTGDEYKITWHPERKQFSCRNTNSTSFQAYYEPDEIVSLISYGKFERMLK